MPPVARLLSAAIVGLSFWCAAGLVTVAGGSASLRVAVPASPLWAIAGALVALAVPGLARPWRAAPALVSVWPWLPVPVPAAALVFTGPMAWLPIALTVGAGLLGPRGQVGVGRPAVPPARQAALAALVTLIAGVATAVSVADRLPGGDEPHYLVITDSLLRDGDLRIENNHVRRDYAAYFGGDLRPDFIQRGRDGEIYSIHAPGVSALVAPGFALAGYRGAQATVLLLSALTGYLVWMIGWQTSGRADAAWFAWAAVTLTPPALLLSAMVFPDGPGAVAVATGLWLLVRLRDPAARVGSGALVAVGGALSVLPWLHTRFSILAAGLGLAIVAGLWQSRDRTRRVAVFAAIPAAMAAAWFTSFWVIYGTVNPAAPYGANPDSRLSFVPGGLAGLLFDQQFGLLPYAPVLLVVPFAIAARSTAVARIAVAIGLAYAAAAATYWMWWAGLPAPPARFLTAALPLAVPALAVFWGRASEATRGGLLVAAWLSASVASATVLVGRGALAWNTRDGQAAWLEWMSPVANLPRAWPSFFWRLDPSDLGTEWPFVVHAALFTLTLVAGFVVMRACASRAAAVGRAAIVVPAAIAALAIGGWFLNGVGGLDPARSQARVASAAADGRQLIRVAPWSLGIDPAAVTTLRITPDEPGRSDEPPGFAVFEGLPGGQYALDVVPSVAAGPLELRLGRSAEPYRSAMLEPGGRFTLPVSLPAGAAALSVSVGGRSPGDGIQLRVLTLSGTGGEAAVQSARYGDVDVFFLDHRVFVEPDGFWVRGGSTAAMVFALDRDVGAVTVTLQNGATPNAVGVDANGRVETWQMTPFESRAVQFDPVGGEGVSLRVSSPGGFRPSDDGRSGDSRFLGVRVSVARSR